MTNDGAHSLRPGDVVLAQVPFSTLQSDKLRPALVVSSAAHNERSADCIVLAITSSAARAAFGVPVAADDCVEGDLLRRPEDKAKAWGDLCLAKAARD